MSDSCSKEFSLSVSVLCPCEESVLHEPSNDLRPAIKDYVDSMFSCPGCSTFGGFPAWDGIFRANHEVGGTPDCCCWTNSTSAGPEKSFDAGHALVNTTAVSRNHWFFPCVTAVAGWKVTIYGGIAGSIPAWFGVGPNPTIGTPQDTPVGVYNYFDPAGAASSGCETPLSSSPSSIEIIAIVPPP
jgi:hypothetical protein